MVKKGRLFCLHLNIASTNYSIVVLNDSSSGSSGSSSGGGGGGCSGGGTGSTDSNSLIDCVIALKKIPLIRGWIALSFLE